MELMLLEVGTRIRALREICGVTPAEMAACTGVSEEMYREYEAGTRDFTFTFIYKCAKRLGIEATDLMGGTSPKLSSYCVCRAGGGLPIARRAGFQYNNLAPLFKNKIAEPFRVVAKYSEEEQKTPIKCSTHVGQEFDFILSGQLKVTVDGHEEVLGPGDTIYYDSGSPHGMIATGGADCEFLAVVIGGDVAAYGEAEETQPDVLPTKETRLAPAVKDPVAARFIETEEDGNGVLRSIRFKNTENYNFVYDTIDAIAAKTPDKLAMLHLDSEKRERRFTFADLKELSSRAANYFVSLGVKEGDRVMLVLKQHWQFWVAILALHRIGAVAIPATCQLMEKDFTYRFNKVGVSMLVCTGDGVTAAEAESAAAKIGGIKLVMANGKRDGWLDFDGSFMDFPASFERPAGVGGEKPMLMLFTSGTSGYPRTVAHSFTYALGHYITARYWHNVEPDGLHYTISDTGWGKALWGKLYGQWLCEAPIFTYDFDRFHAEDILPLFAQYGITTFCAPPTMYRFFIKEDLSKYDLSSLRYANTAGEALNAEVFQQFRRATGLTIMEGFGQTETTMTVGNLVGTEARPGSMGKPSPMYDVDILLPDGRPAAAGETGEVVVRTDKGVPPGLFLGYWNDVEKTASAWHDGCYHTGDTAWRDEDGYFWYVGRVDDLIKSSGYRIGPFEIESVIMELPYVLECAVTGVPDPIRGQVVKASIVLTRGTEKSEERKKEIQQYVKTHTAPYKYPRIVEFFDELPKTISGKIRRVELREK